MQLAQDEVDNTAVEPKIEKLDQERDPHLNVQVLAESSDNTATEETATMVIRQALDDWKGMY